MAPMPVVGGPGWATGMGAIGFTPPAPRIVLDWSSIVGFGQDAVVAATESSVREPASEEELAAISGGSLLDRPLMTDAGDIVGAIADVEFDADTGRLTAFVVGDRVVPLTRLVAVGPFAVIVAAPDGPHAPARDSPWDSPPLVGGQHDRRIGAMTEDKKHVGDFAEGQAEEHAEQGELMGDFAAGQEKEEERLGTVQPKGTFAEGQAEEKPDPTAPRGNFAEGQEEKE
jgi:sporulation protein YlmC with PRC-barrel domain